ncbi:uncharacterized protein LOC127261867 [Andrographis paniculata]|uniref:uncharacterized protein LOC127261867 n=1 Tax=Andrographis paniculata TaxID=175694 RepID=UPI0021E8C8A9|nr:uncharacterized protein LOC127261867 [Andrographis paniculata]
MEVFQRAKAVRLKNCHDKYLTADEDEESVAQDRRGSSKSAKWMVEFVENTDGAVIRLRSCYGKYLTASNQPFLLGMTGRKVLQTRPSRLDSSVEWEPVQENGALKLKTRHGQFLRANGGLPPWRNSVTHDIPHRTATQEWIVWEVHVVEILPAPAPAEADSLSSADDSLSFTRQEWKDDGSSSFISRPKCSSNGRLIYFHIADEEGRIDEAFEELCIRFKGNRVEELTTKLEEELEIEGITVCARNPLNGNLLYPLRLHLPPNNASMHVVVLPPTYIACI